MPEDERKRIEQSDEVPYADHIDVCPANGWPPCDHGSYYLDDDGMRHCLMCSDVRPQPTCGDGDS